jgi:hypothetical protein
MIIWPPATERTGDYRNHQRPRGLLARVKQSKIVLISVKGRKEYLQPPISIQTIQKHIQAQIHRPLTTTKYFPTQ